MYSVDFRSYNKSDLPRHFSKVHLALFKNQNSMFWNLACCLTFCRPESGYLHPTQLPTPWLSHLPPAWLDHLPPITYPPWCLHLHHVYIVSFLHRSIYTRVLRFDTFLIRRRHHGITSGWALQVARAQNAGNFPSNTLAEFHRNWVLVKFSSYTLIKWSLEMFLLCIAVQLPYW